MDPISIIGYIALAVGAVLSILSRIPKQTIANQKDLIETYEKRLKALEDQKDEDRKQNIENVKAIADLQGQIKVYKELPLQEMAIAMQNISDVNKGIAVSNQKILEILTSSAITLAHETELNTQGTNRVAEDLKASDLQSQVVDKQTVVHQVVKNKE